MKDHINEIKEKSSGYMTAAFGLVAGLAWNDAIKSFIEFAFPFSTSGSILAKFIYAVIITIVVILLSQYIFKNNATPIIKK